MALSKNCIISSIFPLPGHEAAIGLDLLNHPERKEIVEKTIETHETFVAGPVQLVEGGIAFISYTPIFDKTNPGEERFWGVTDIVILKDRLLSEAHLREKEMGFRFALKGYNGLGDAGAVFYGNDSIFMQSPVLVDIALPYGSWVLAAVPEKGWNSYPDQDKALFVILLISSFIISLLTWLFSRAIVRIRMNEQELTAIFRSMSSLVIEFDRDGRYIKIAPTNMSLLYTQESRMLNRTVYEVFDPQTASYFHEAIVKCLDTRELVVIEYPLAIGGKERWFTARLSWKSDRSVIYQAYEITDQKKMVEELAQSEQNLARLNSTKDTFFSILAHDLRSPFNQILGFSTLLKEDYDNLGDIERKDFILRVSETARQTLWLVDNLLNWSQSQRGLLSYSPAPVRLNELADQTFSIFAGAASGKDITLANRIPEATVVTADRDMLSSVLRNLVSNAIKYTPRQGIIAILTEPGSPGEKNLIRVVVEDTGIGMDEDVLENLFSLERKTSRAGTMGEKGTGLGLLLCSDLIDKHGQRLWAEGGPGNGSRFIFTMPLAT